MNADLIPVARSRRARLRGLALRRRSRAGPGLLIPGCLQRPHLRDAVPARPSSWTRRGRVVREVRGVGPGRVCRLPRRRIGAGGPLATVGCRTMGSTAKGILVAVGRRGGDLHRRDAGDLRLQRPRQVRDARDPRHRDLPFPPRARSTSTTRSTSSSATTSGWSRPAGWRSRSRPWTAERPSPSCRRSDQSLEHHQRGADRPRRVHLSADGDYQVTATAPATGPGPRPDLRRGLLELAVQPACRSTSCSPRGDDPGRISSRGEGTRSRRGTTT